MFKLYRKESSRFTNWVEGKLDELVVAHKIITVTEDTSLPKGIDTKKLPLLSDGHNVWTSKEVINSFLQELEQNLILSRCMQSDACYLDPDNLDKCL